MAGLVAEGVHAQNGPGAAPKQGQGEEGELGHPPPTGLGAALVKAHEGEGKQIGRQQPQPGKALVGEQLGHFPSPLSGSIIPHLPPERKGWVFLPLIFIALFP